MSEVKACRQMFRKIKFCVEYGEAPVRSSK